MSKIILFFIFLFLIPNFSWAISGSIRGKVTDKSTGRNLAGAQVWVLLSNTSQIRAQAISDAEGNFIIENLQNNTYDIEASAAGQISQKIIGLQITNNAIRLAYFKMNSNKNLMASGNSRAYRDSVELVYTYASLQARQNAQTKSATASDQTLLDQPATGYIINSDDIQFRGYVTLLDVLRDVPEIEINDNASTDFGSIISSRAAKGIGRWYVMQDGIKINSLMGSDITLCQNIPIRHAEKIEIVMGAASAVYGADAFSGVINIVSKDANKINGAELHSSFGSFNETNNSLVIGAAKKNVSVLYSGSFFDTKNPKYNEIYTDEYAFYNNNFLTNGLVRASPFDTTRRRFGEAAQPFALPARTVSSSLLVKYKNWSFGLSSFNETHSSSLSTRPEFNPPVADNRYSTSVNSAYILHDWQTKKWNLQSSVQVNQNFIFPQSAYNNTFSAYQRVYKYGYERHGFLREVLNYQINKSQQLTFGFSAQLSNALARTANLPQIYNTSLPSSEQIVMYHTGTDTVDYTGRFLGVPIEYYEENRVQGGLSAQYQINIKDKLDLIAGGRFDYLRVIHPLEEESHTYMPLNARAGLVYKPNKNIRVKLFYGSAFLTPSPNKTLSYFGSFRLLKDSLGRITNVSPNLWKLPTNERISDSGEPVPEQLQSVESSFIYTKNDLLFSVNGYYNILSNILANELFYNLPFFDSLSPVPVAQITTSEGQGIAYGVTARIEYIWRIAEQTNIRTNASYAYVGGQLTDDDGRSFALPFTAQHTIKAGLGFQYQKFSIYIKGLYRSASFNEGTVSNTGQYVQKGNAPFLIFSAFANYQLAALDKERFLIDIFVRARNLTNARYYNTSTLNSAAFDAVPQEPFGIFGGVQLRFDR